MKHVMLAAALLGLVSLSSGCVHPRFAGDIARAAIVTAAIVGTAAIIAEHDAHMHYEACGCPRQWHEDHWVYYYGGWWEYYDPGAGAWYHY